MKKNFYTLNYFIFLILIQPAYSQVAFQKAYGRSAYENAAYVHQTSDSGYFIAGNCSGGFSGGKIRVIKTDINGDTLWTKTFDGPNDDYCSAAIQTYDGGYLINGWAYTGTNNSVLFIKTDADANILWQKSYGGGTVFALASMSICQTSDSGYITAGDLQSLSTSDQSIYVLKTDSDGVVSWAKSIIFNGLNLGFKAFVRQADDGGYVLAGDCNNPPDGHDFFLIKLNASGNVLWSKLYGGHYHDDVRCFEKTSDGGYILGGNSVTWGRKTYVVKVDSAGGIQWSKTYKFDNDQSGSALVIKEAAGGGYFLGGGTTQFASLPQDAFFLRTDSAGDALWAMKYTGFEVDGLAAAEQTNDNGYILGGATYSYGAGNSDLYVLKTDSTGNSGCNQSALIVTTTNPPTQDTIVTAVDSSVTTITTIPNMTISGSIIVTPLCSNVSTNEIKEPAAINVFPNPVTDKLTITTTNNSLSEIILYDIASRKLLQQNFTNTVTLNIAQLAKGMYVYEVRNGKGEVRKEKVVKE